MTGHIHVCRQRGFTMVELIVVMVLTGILGAVGAARFFDRSGYDADAFSEQARAMLRYAQKVAIAQSRRVFVRIEANGMVLCFREPNPDCAGPDRVIGPPGVNGGSTQTVAFCGQGDWYCLGRPANLVLASNRNAATVFFFAPLGRPYAATDADPAGADSFVVSTFAPLTLTISGAGATRTVGVSPETGYVF